MFELVIDTRKISVRRREKITAGSVGIRVGFEFSSDWDGLGRTAVFETDRRKIAVVLTENTVTLPWEVCEEAGFDVSVGVYGTNGDGSIVIPTVWTKLETVSSGADCTDAENTRTPTASDVQQMSTAAATAVTAAGKAQLAAEKAEELAADVKARADSGEFNGRDGTNGIDGSSVTITGISESGESGGISTVTFSDGRTLTVRNGIDGQGGGSEVNDTAVREWGFAYKSEVEAVENELSRFDLFDWELLANSDYPTGWRAGYFGKETGISYITATWSRTRRYLYRRNQYCYLQADYPVRVHAFTANPSYGDHADNTGKLVWYMESSDGEPLRFKTDDILYIVVSVRCPLETLTDNPPKLYWVFPNVPTVSRISADSTDTEIPSAKAVWELFNSVPNAEGVGF